MTLNRTFAALCLFALVACGGPKKKPDEGLIENTNANENCCCRIETDDPDDPTFTRAAVMDCSARHGTCLQSDTQCEGQPEPTEDTTTDSGSLPPTVEDTPTSF
jgi:hypothetical protein